MNLTSRAQQAFVSHPPSYTGWYVGFGIGIFLVVVVGALVLAIISLANAIATAAPSIDGALQQAVRNTAPLAALRNTISYAQVIVAGLRRGRERLGG